MRKLFSVLRFSILLGALAFSANTALGLQSQASAQSPIAWGHRGPHVGGCVEPVCDIFTEECCILPT